MGLAATACTLVVGLVLVVCGAVAPEIEDLAGTAAELGSGEVGDRGIALGWEQPLTPDRIGERTALEPTPSILREVRVRMGRGRRDGAVVPGYTISLAFCVEDCDLRFLATTTNAVDGYYVLSLDAFQTLPQRLREHGDVVLMAGQSLFELESLLEDRRGEVRGNTFYVDLPVHKPPVIAGRVTDELGRGIAGAQVFCDLKNGGGGGYTFSDVNGRYEFWKPRKPYTFRAVSAQGVSDTVDSDGSKPLDSDLVVRHGEGVLQGRVAMTSGAEMAYCLLYFERLASGQGSESLGRTHGVAITDPQGGFRITGLSPGVYTLDLEDLSLLQVSRGRKWLPLGTFPSGWTGHQIVVQNVCVRVERAPEPHPELDDFELSFCGAGCGDLLARHSRGGLSAADWQKAASWRCCVSAYSERDYSFLAPVDALLMVRASRDRAGFVGHMCRVHSDPRGQRLVLRSSGPSCPAWVHSLTPGS